MNKFWTFVVGYLRSFALIAWAVAVNGFILAKLWGWFVSTVFLVPPITWAQACGLWCVVSLMRRKANDCKSEPDQAAEAKLLFYHLVMMPAVALLVGWVVHTWVTP